MLTDLRLGGSQRPVADDAADLHIECAAGSGYSSGSSPASVRCRSFQGKAMPALDREGFAWPRVGSVAYHCQLAVRGVADSAELARLGLLATGTHC